MLKSFVKSVVESILAKRARRFLELNKVQVIGVTGSVGKTSTKEAIYTVLKSKFKVERSRNSFNTTLGLSLTVLGEKKSGFSSPSAWWAILRRSKKSSREAPEKMVLEMGADGPGDLNKLMAIAPPQISVITAVQPVHMAEGQFESLEDIAQEKGTLVRHLSSSGVAVLNGDDPRVAAMETPAKRITYGQKEGVDLRVFDLKMTAIGIEFDVHYQNKKAHCRVPLVGDYQIYVCLPAIAVGLALGLELEACCLALADYKLPPGRLNPIEGLEQSQILDGSYNASPTAVEAALAVLQQFEASRKIVALGTMNELGLRSNEAHLAIGALVPEAAELLIAVGKEAQTLKQGAMGAGMSESNIFTFFDSEKAGEFLKGQLMPGDLILVKGSQNQVRMERFVKLIMAKPNQAKELLCRQEDQWERI